ncbi:hypothetical protein JCM6882_008677 [Rhodosporidiobolus microsporus]
MDFSPRARGPLEDLRGVRDALGGVASGNSGTSRSGGRFGEESVPEPLFRYDVKIPFAGVASAVIGRRGAVVDWLQTEADLPVLSARESTAHGRFFLLVGKRSSIRRALELIDRLIYVDTPWNEKERASLRDNSWVAFVESKCEQLSEAAAREIAPYRPRHLPQPQSPIARRAMSSSLATSSTPSGIFRYVLRLPYDYIASAIVGRRGTIVEWLQREADLAVLTVRPPSSEGRFVLLVGFLSAIRHALSLIERRVYYDATWQDVEWELLKNRSWLDFNEASCEKLGEVAVSQLPKWWLAQVHNERQSTSASPPLQRSSEVTLHYETTLPFKDLASFIEGPRGSTAAGIRRRCELRVVEISYAANGTATLVLDGSRASVRRGLEEVDQLIYDDNRETWSRWEWEQLRERGWVLFDERKCASPSGASRDRGPRWAYEGDGRRRGDDDRWAVPMRWRSPSPRRSRPSRSRSPEPARRAKRDERERSPRRASFRVRDSGVAFEDTREQRSGTREVKWETKQGEMGSSCEIRLPSYLVSPFRSDTPPLTPALHEATGCTFEFRTVSGLEETSLTIMGMEEEGVKKARRAVERVVRAVEDGREEEEWMEVLNDELLDDPASKHPTYPSSAATLDALPASDPIPALPSFPLSPGQTPPLSPQAKSDPVEWFGASGSTGAAQGALGGWDGRASVDGEEMEWLGEEAGQRGPETREMEGKERDGEQELEAEQPTLRSTFVASSPVEPKPASTSSTFGSFPSVSSLLASSPSFSTPPSAPRAMRAADFALVGVAGREEGAAEKATGERWKAAF